MAQALFIWLGAKRAEKRGVGEQGVLLDRVTRAGLPVPRGGILLDDFYQSALNDGLFAVANGRLTCPDPLLLHDALYEAIRFPKLPKPVVVRPIFSPTDGRFPSQVNVHFTDPVQLADSLSAVYTSALAQPANVRRDVMVMEMVDIVVSGTAVTDTSDPSDTITYDDQSMTVPQLGHFQRASSDVPPFAQRLQKLLRGVRRTLGKGNWRIEWADDDDVCWLTQIMRLRTREEM